MNIHAEMLVTEIVSRDYRTAEVFSKYGIDFCCGGKRPLSIVCKTSEIPCDDLLDELKSSMREVTVSNSLDFNSWETGFLVDYIVNIHHSYLRRNFPLICDLLLQFVEVHKKKFTYLDELEAKFHLLKTALIPHIEYEEKIIFPYIKQITNAYSSNAAYAPLLVKTLRKPVENLNQERGEILELLQSMRDITSNYMPPENACVRHRVIYHKLKELDNDLFQHIHLESNILFPRALSLEKELLSL